MEAINRLPFLDMSKSTTGCCPKFEVNKWDKKEFNFDAKPFVKFSTRSFLYIPLNFGSKLRAINSEIEDAGIATDEFVMLTDNASPWRSDHLMAVGKQSPELETTTLTGKFVAKVFEGKFKEEPTWRLKLLDFVKEQGYKPLKTYFYYTTCPKCAKSYGKNYVVGFEQVEYAGA